MQCSSVQLWQQQARFCTGAAVHSRYRTVSRPCNRLGRRSLLCRSQYSFVLYIKPDCPLCDGLKDKVQALIDRAQFMPSNLTGSTLEVRDITSNKAWQDAMDLAVPVLAVVNYSGHETALPRPPPRVTAEKLQRHLEVALQHTATGLEQQ